MLDTKVLTKIILKSETEFTHDEASYLAQEISDNYYSVRSAMHDLELWWIGLWSFILGVLVVVIFNMIKGA